MDYHIEPITRSRLEAEGKRLISSYDMARIVKSWWRDAAHTRSLFANHPYLDGPVYVATNKAYFPKSLLAGAATTPDKLSITAQQFYDACCLVVPSLSMFSRGRNNKSLVHLQTLMMQDIKWPACLCDGRRRCRCRTLKPERLPPAELREAIGPDNYTTLCKFLKIEYKNGDIKSYLQGGKSVIQTKVMAPRVRGIRAQILCDFKVAADTIVVPETFARDFGLTAGEYVTIDPTQIGDNDADILPAECVYPIDERLGVIVKRDPCIHPASVSTVSRIAVTEHDNFYVSPLTMGHKNADIDGDVYGVYIVESRAAADEIRYALHPRNSMILKTGGNTTRLSFSQVHVFYMQGRLHLLSPRFARYVEVARAECASHEDNEERDRFRRHYMPEAHDEWFEPTRRILDATALSVATHLGSNAAYELFDEINALVVQVARTIWFTLGDNLACELLCRIAASGAKSNLTAYASLMDKLRSIDGTCALTAIPTTPRPPLAQRPPSPPRRDFAKITSVIRDMAVSAMLVPRLGYNWFKTYSTWSGLQLRGGRLSYNGRDVGPLDSFRPTGLIFSATDIARLLGCGGGDRPSLL